MLVESGDGEGITFTVEPRGERAWVRIDTVLNVSALERLLLPLLAPRLLQPIYADELARLEQLAQAHAREPTAQTARTA